MKEEEVRKIVRDEIDIEMFREGGVADEIRKQNFSMTRGILKQVFAVGLASFGPERRGPSKSSEPA